MRELTTSDMDQTSGGILPLIALGVALGGFAKGGAGIFLGSVGVGMAGYSAAKYLTGSECE